MTDEHRVHRMAGCACLGKLILGMAAAALAVYCLLNLNQCFYCTDRGSVRIQVRNTVIDLRTAIEAYRTEYARLPIPESDSSSLDASIRSRGPMLPALMGVEITPLSPREIIFIHLPQARDRKNGLWQDGSDWVLSDWWGEPYYIVFDTSKDGKIANPEFGAEQSDLKYAEKCKLTPPPATIQRSVLIYSSGPDRNPKTWHDNVCSWRE